MTPVNDALNGTGMTDGSGRPLQFTRHNFRRIFITDAIMHGMPPHIARGRPGKGASPRG